MSNVSYEDLHKLVDYLIKNHIMETKDIAKILGLTLKQFIEQYMSK